MSFAYEGCVKRARVFVHARTHTGAGTVRGKRHGEVDLVGGFSDTDHVIAYKLLHNMSGDKQLTKMQVPMCACTGAHKRAPRIVLVSVAQADLILCQFSPSTLASTAP